MSQTEWRNQPFKLSDAESSSSDKSTEDAQVNESESTQSDEIEEEFISLPDGSPTFTAVMNELSSTLSKSSLSDHIKIPVLPDKQNEEAPVVKSLHFEIRDVQPHSFYSPAIPRKRLDSPTKSPELAIRSRFLNFRSKSATERRNTPCTSLNSSKNKNHFGSPLIR